MLTLRCNFDLWTYVVVIAVTPFAWGCESHIIYTVYNGHAPRCRREVLIWSRLSQLPASHSGPALPCPGGDGEGAFRFNRHSLLPPPPPPSLLEHLLQQSACPGLSLRLSSSIQALGLIIFSLFTGKFSGHIKIFHSR